MLIESKSQWCQLKSKSFYIKKYKSGISRIKRVNKDSIEVRAGVRNTRNHFFGLMIPIGKIKRLYNNKSNNNEMCPVQDSCHSETFLSLKELKPKD